jgi:hypothetical protein
VIYLSKATPISAGDFRVCYRHPADATKCIKVAKPRAQDFHVGRVERLLGRSAVDPNEREFREYERLKRKGVPLHTYFPRVDGFVETDLGRGLVVDFVCGTDLQPPVSIKDYAKGNVRPVGLTDEVVMTGLRDFGEFCSRYGILGACTETHNIGFVRTSDGFRCVSYDLKIRFNKELIPVSSLFAFARRRKIARRFARTIAKVDELLANTPKPQ